MTDNEKSNWVRHSDLTPSQLRTIEQFRALGPEHRRQRPEPDNPSRPELEVLKRIATMRAAVEQRKRDEREGKSNRPPSAE